MFISKQKTVLKSSLLKRFYAIRQSYGLLAALQKTVTLPLRRLRNYRVRKTIKKYKTAEERFTRIYKHNLWGSENSASGTGSTLEHTKALREALPKLFKSYDIQTIFDAPCGDFHWMKDVLSNSDFKYIGADIVRPMIEHLKKSETTDNVQFHHLDITKAHYPKADLMICRDCLFHLSFKDTLGVLQRFINSEIQFLLTTTHTPETVSRNTDIETGDFRHINLLEQPYCFPKNYLLEIDDWLPPEGRRYMYLWDRDQIKIALAELTKFLIKRDNSEQLVA